MNTHDIYGNAVFLQFNIAKCAKGLLLDDIVYYVCSVTPALSLHFLMDECPDLCLEYLILSTLHVMHYQYVCVNMCVYVCKKRDCRSRSICTRELNSY